jgi:hypothetical protein
MVIITLTTINTFADEFVGGENGLVAKIREYNYITVFKQFLCFILEIKREQFINIRGNGSAILPLLGVNLLVY